MKDITDNIGIPVNCESNVNKNILTITLDNKEKLDALKNYEV